MADPISLAAGYFILKTAISMGISLGENVTADNIGNELIKGAGGNFYYDLMKFGTISGSRTAWNNIVSRIRSEYNSDKPLNHDLQKAIRRAQLEATLSACESSFDDLRKKDRTLLEKLKYQLALNAEEEWLKNVIRSLNANLREVKSENYLPPPMTDDDDVLKIADQRNYPLSDESVRALADSMKEQTVLEIRLTHPPNYSQDAIALSLERKIYHGWQKTFDGEIVSVDWYKLLCGRFNEEYKSNSIVSNALQKAFFHDIKHDLTAGNRAFEKKFADFSGAHFEKLGDDILARLRNIESKQDHLFEFLQLFSDETGKKIEDTAKETQQVVHSAIGDLEIMFRDRLDDMQKMLADVQEYARKRERPKVRPRPPQIHHRKPQPVFEERDVVVRWLAPDVIIGKDRKEQILEHFSQLRPEPGAKTNPSSLDQFVYSLKKRYQNRYINKLDNRFEISLRVNENWTFSEKFDENAGEGKAIDIVSNLFAKGGRLLIIGNPGVGKTVLLLKLANDLLNRADIQDGDAFPVIFNLAAWTDEYASFRDWLIVMLNRAEGLSLEMARNLLEEERIVFMLDGLDELGRNESKAAAEALRAKCMDSLTDYLDYGKKAVICSRVHEFIQMQNETGQIVPVNKIIRVLDLTPKQITIALTEALSHEKSKVAAHNLRKILHEDKSGVFAKVLGISFYFTAALTVFDRQIIKEKEFPTEEAGLKKYLIEKFIERKLETTPNPKKFDPRHTLHWLKWLARLMNKKDKITFELADLQPGDLKRPWLFRVFFSFAICALLYLTFYFAMICGQIFYFINLLTQSLDPNWIARQLSQAYTLKALLNSLIFSILIFTFLFVFGAPFFILPFSLIFSFRLDKIQTEDIGSFSLRPLIKWRTWKNVVLTSFLYCLPVIAFFVLFLSTIPKSMPDAEFYKMRFSLIIVMLTVIFLISVERIYSHCQVIKTFSIVNTPYQRLRAGVLRNFVKWFLISILFIGFMYLAELAISDFSRTNPGYLVNAFRDFFPLFVFLSLINTALLKHFTLRLYQKLAGRVPLKLRRFLDYAAEVRMLEKDGGFWRFRHQELQDYFAKLP